MKKFILLCLLIFLCGMPGKSQTINTFLDQTGEDLIGILEDCNYVIGPGRVEDGDTIRVCKGDLYGYPVRLEMCYKIFVTELVIDFLGSENLEEMFYKMRDDLSFTHSYTLGTSVIPNFYVLFFDDYSYVLSFYKPQRDLRFTYHSYGKKNKTSESIMKLGKEK